jgi:hypothetical protein
MFTIKNILIVLLLSFIIYKIIPKKIKKIKKTKKEKFTPNYFNYNDTNNIKKKIPTYGTDQFMTFDYDYENDNNNDFNNSNGHDIDIKKVISKKLPPKTQYNIESKIYKGIYKKTNLPCQQDEVYDLKFNKSSKEFDEDMLQNSNISNTKNKTIKEVYDSMIVDYKKSSKTNNIDKVEEFNNITFDNVHDNLDYNPLMTNISEF